MVVRTVRRDQGDAQDVREVWRSNPGGQRNGSSMTNLGQWSKNPETRNETAECCVVARSVSARYGCGSDK